MAKVFETPPFPQGSDAFVVSRRTIVETTCQGNHRVHGEFDRARHSKKVKEKECSSGDECFMAVFLYEMLYEGNEFMTYGSTETVVS